MVLYRIQSSANNLVFEATDSGRSFIKMRKSSQFKSSDIYFYNIRIVYLIIVYDYSVYI